MTPIEKNKEINFLFDYVKSFYGKKGIYPDFLPDLKDIEISKAIDERLNMKEPEFVGYDSLDREIVRDIILINRGLKTEIEYFKWSK